MAYEMKPLFAERMQKLLGAEDFKQYAEVIKTPPRHFIRCNTLKISCEKLIARLRERWDIEQPFKKHPEIMLIVSRHEPGALGSSLEHQLGYYYIQEISSMLSAIALQPQPGDFVFDMCAAPGSKTTQIAALMENKGSIIANDIKLDRIRILSANMQRCGVANAVLTHNDGINLCEKLAKHKYLFDKILLDAPCSGEGTLRSDAKMFTMWSPQLIQNFSSIQRKMIATSINSLKPGGVLVYSTCTHAPEENEGVIDFALRKFPVEIVPAALPLKTRPGITSWGKETFDDSVKNCSRIYPHDNDSEGFFVAKIIKKQ